MSKFLEPSFYEHVSWQQDEHIDRIKRSLKSALDYFEKAEGDEYFPEGGLVEAALTDIKQAAQLVTVYQWNRERFGGAIRLGLAKENRGKQDEEDKQATPEKDDLDFYRDGLESVVDFWTKELHPTYGPCDSMGEKGSCCVCARELKELKEKAWKYDDLNK